MSSERALKAQAIHDIPRRSRDARFWEAVWGAGASCGDFAEAVKTFRRAGASPVVEKFYRPDGLLTTTQVVGDKTAVSA